MNKLDKELVICDCGSTEHQMIFIWDEIHSEVYMEVHLAKKPFWQRVKFGIKYIFGYHCKYGHWDEIVLNKEHIPQFEKIINYLKK